jgi:hypothetical protein
VADQLFDRRVKLTVGQEPPTGNFIQLMPTASVITGLRVVFEIEKSLKPEPQKAVVAVYNLSDESRGKFVGKGLRVVLEAGYPDSLAVIYAGHTRDALSARENVDWVTKFECGTNERELAFARVSESFKPGASVFGLVKKCVQAVAKDGGNLNSLEHVITDTFSSGYSAHGNAAQELTNLLEPRGYSWSVQDGRMQILRADEATADEPVLLSPDTGLVGSPELGAPIIKGGPSVLKVKSLLQAKLAPGKRFLLNSHSRSGVFRILKLAHKGDTHGGDWYTEMEAVPSK